jgi:uncharacterized protein YjbI with pentapeptide repeats
VPKKPKTASLFSLKLIGKRVALVGKFPSYQDTLRAELEKLARDEGATLVDGEKVVADIYVHAGGRQPAVVTKVLKKHPGVHVHDVNGFYARLAFTADEFLAVLRGGPYEWQRWSELHRRVPSQLDLSGTDARTLKLDHANLQLVTLDDSDFRGMTLKDVQFDTVSGAKFDGAKFEGGSVGPFRTITGASFKKAEMDDTRWNPATFETCDFADAFLRIPTGSYTRATGCSFKNATMYGGYDQSAFTDCDFSGARMTDANFSKTDFAGSKFVGASFERADLRGAKFTNADLRKARFHDAILSDADFTGANVAGADFAGANVRGAIVAGLDLSKAKYFDTTPARTAGPKMLDLAQVAGQCRRLETTVELGLTGDHFVTLTASVATYGATKYPGATHTRHEPSNRTTFGSYVDCPTFEQGMLNLVDLYSHGKPRIDTVKATAKQCPLKPKELLALARAAWCEALGLPVISDDEWAKRDAASDAATLTLRDEMLAELRGGSKGVAAFNARSDKEREQLGGLKKADFRAAKLARVNLEKLDLQAANFDGAALTDAQFWCATVKGASFRNANAAKASFACVKAADASFEGAKLSSCNLRGASFMRANFRDADLSGSCFDGSNLCGADFTGAKLTKVEFESAKFDAATKFPTGYTPPDAMLWVGDGAHPGKLSRVTTTTAGSMDFAAFLKALGGKVDAARIAKATAMLKAERFQLFADVTDAAVSGIVKSQSDATLLYSCRLGSDGSFGCGTQNAKPCGGLHGALCKHLLVLLIGLTKAGELDAATIDNWVNTSRVQGPTFDKDALAGTFLKYKGAEAGEIEWRPTETIPEDFYAM